MQTLREGLKVFGAIFVAILVGEVPAVKAWAQMIDEQQGWLLPLTIGLAVVGFLMLLWGFVGAAAMQGRPMTSEEFEQLSARTQILGPGKRFSKARFWGKSKGVVVPDTEWHFQDMKSAWGAGTWWTDPDMRRKYIITAGGMMTSLALFAVGLVVFPVSVKLILAGAILYMVVRVTLAFRRA